MVERNYKKTGENLLREGIFLGDTSGRTREINEKSVLAFASNNIEYSVRLLSKEKTKIFARLKDKGMSEDKAKTLIHSVKLYYALAGYIDSQPGFYICCDGFNIILLKQNLRLLLKEKYNDNKIKILDSLVPMFGKYNLAHRLANDVREGRKKPTRDLKYKDFKKLELI